MQWEMIITAGITAVAGIAAIVILLWMFSRWEERYEKRIVETSREIRGQMRAEKERFLAEAEKTAKGIVDNVTRTAGGYERTISSNKGRLDEFSNRLGDLRKYQESMRESLEKALGEAELRWARFHPDSDKSESDTDNLRRMKEQLPLLEEGLIDYAEHCRESNKLLRKLIDQQKSLAEKSGGIKSPEEATAFAKQVRDILQGGGKALNSASEAFGAANSRIQEFVDFISSIYKVCEICDNTSSELSVCLSCYRKFCDDCKGMQIGHCKECAPSYRPLHIDISEK